MAVDYGAGASSAIASQYESLRQALADKGLAENLREARNIERKGLFGTGIRTSDIQGLASAGLGVAEFGQTRMEGQMDRATKSFDRRVTADERRLKTLQQRWKTADPESRGNIMQEMEGIEMGMGERRNKFEDTLGDYRKKGLWGTGFGSEDVGYRTEGRSQWSKDTQGGGGGPGGGGPRDGGPRDGGPGDGMPPMRDFERSASQLGGPEFRGGTKIGENAPIGPEGLNARMKREYLERKRLRDQAAPDRSQYFPGRDSEDGSEGMMNLGERPFGIGGKKKDSLGSLTVGISDGMVGGPPQVSATSNKFTSGPPKRDNYRRALHDALPQAGLSAEEMAARDAAEKQELIKGKEQALSRQKTEEDLMIQDVVNKRRRKKLEDLVAGIDLN